MLSTGVAWAAWMPFSIIRERANLDLLTSAHRCTHPSASVSRSLLMIPECQYSADEPHPSFGNNSGSCIPVFLSHVRGSKYRITQLCPQQERS